MTMNFKHLKAGDQVYLVEQARRSSTPHYTEVVKVGRKYGYILGHGREEPFDLLTGQSVHGNDSNTRFNGFGFDVWPSKEAHDAHITELEERKRLSTRIESLSHGKYGPRLAHASPELVADLHAVLDRHGI
jgi:hypothetical protein